MKCKECDEEGISLFSKFTLMFETTIHCRKCGTSFEFGRGLKFFIGFLFQSLVVLSIFYAFSELDKVSLYWAIGASFVALCIVISVLPLRVVRRLAGRRRSKTYNKPINK